MCGNLLDVKRWFWRGGTISEHEDEHRTRLPTLLVRLKFMCRGRRKQRPGIHWKCDVRPGNVVLVGINFVFLKACFSSVIIQKCSAVSNDQELSFKQELK